MGWSCKLEPIDDRGRVWLPYWSQRTILVLPLWIPFLLLALPTTLLFCLDRRAPSGHCRKCRYDLRGNSSGICPECGQAASTDP
jgi:hypothetical protein